MPSVNSLQKYTIAIVMATYNGEKFIKEQVTSILNQSYHSFKLYISDDNSRDNTVRILSDFNDDRIHIYTNTDNGVVKNFNNGLSKTSEELIFLCDQDDIWPVDRLEILIDFYRKTHEGKPFLSFTDLELINKDNETISKNFYNYINVDPNYNKEFNYLTWRCTAYGCTMMLNRALLNLALPIPDDSITTMHDNWLILVASLVGEIHYIPYCSVRYRQHDGNHTGGGSRSTLKKIKSSIKMVKLINETQIKRIKQLGELSKRGVLETGSFKCNTFFYLRDCVLIYRRERLLYKVIYCIILIYKNRVKGSILESMGNKIK